MQNAYKRKKEPEHNRRAIIQATALLVSQLGFDGLSLQAIAKQAGVTKGAIFHHFLNKESLIDTTLDYIVEQLDIEFVTAMGSNISSRGSFTEAYVRVILNPEPEGHFWSTFSPRLIQDERLNTAWFRWLDEKLEKHKDTDSDPELELIRYAADGAWISAPVTTKENNKSSRKNIHDILLQKIRKMA